MLLSFSGLQLVSGGISNLSLLELAFSSWEEDQLALVVLQAIDINLQSFF